MGTTKENVHITYDALALKIFMDKNETSFYEKEVYVTDGLSGNTDIMAQMIGNVGGYARFNNFNKEIDIIIFSDKMISELKNNIKPAFICKLEELINQANTPFKKLRFVSEHNLLEFFTMRARARLSQDKKDSKSKKNSSELHWILVESEEEDKLMLEMVKKYKSSSSELTNGELF